MDGLVPARSAAPALTASRRDRRVRAFSVYHRDLAGSKEDVDAMEVSYEEEDRLRQAASWWRSCAEQVRRGVASSSVARAVAVAVCAE